MKVVVTGASRGIGKAIVQHFQQHTYAEIYGIDIVESELTYRRNYTHIIADVSKPDTLPDIMGVDVLINNAGVQNAHDIDVNLMGVINCTQKYGLQSCIRSVVNIASVSAHTGAEFPLYAASKGGVLAYTKWTAAVIATFGATCNSVSPGGVTTAMNKHILDSPLLYAEALNETMLHKWASAQEVAELVYYLTMVNKSITAQDIIMDNGEIAKFNFVW